MKSIRRIARMLAWLFLPALAILTALLAPAGCVLGAATLTFSIVGSASWNYSLAVTGLSNPDQNINSFSFNIATTSGTGAAGTADMLYVSQSAIAGAGSLTINLNSAPGKDFFGANIVMSRVKIFFVNLLTTTTASSIALGNAANPIINWISVGTTTIKLNNGGLWVQGDSGATGYPITASTADQFKILNNDATNTATCNVVIVGSSL